MENFYYRNLKYFLWYPDISLQTTVPQTTDSNILPLRAINFRTFATRRIILEKFPPGQLHPGQLHPMKFSQWQLSPGELPLNSSPWTNIPEQLSSPMKCPHWNCLLNFCSPDIFAWIIPPKQLPQKCHSWNSSQGKCPRTFPLENNPWITYRWCSRKALFKFSSLEILNKLRKRLSESCACYFLEMFYVLEILSIKDKNLDSS